METIQFKDRTYPVFQSEGFAAQFAFPFANKLCRGVGVDIGCNRLKWMLPSEAWRIVTPVDPALEDEYHKGRGEDAYNFKGENLDFIFSSHCLEHLPDWVKALEYWHSKLREGGIVFLYLPDMTSQNYWRPWHNRKHVHYVCPEVMSLYCKDMQHLWANTITTGCDLNSSFYAILEKK